MSKPNPNERRRKIIYVPDSFVVGLLSGGFIENEHIKLPRMVGLPSSARTIGVFNDYARRAFAIVVEDESFEEVEDGCLLPQIEVEWNTVLIPLKY